MKITFTEKVPLMSPSITKKGKFMGAVRGLVGGIGEPSLHEVDPYSVVKYTFPLLFGLMFADLGHGLMLALIGGFFLYKKKKNKIEPDESMSGYIYSGAELLIVCGLTSAFMGVLFGSFFGDETLLPEFFTKLNYY
jgi:V-type H+-transporting ATPase subunit a